MRIVPHGQSCAAPRDSARERRKAVGTVLDRTLSVSGAVLAALVVSLLGVGPGQAAAIRWLQATDDREPWELALDLAQKDREPVMAFVYIGNSQLAQMMDDRTFRDKAVCDAARKFECVRVDALRPENRPLVDKLGLGGAAGTAGQQKYEGGCTTCRCRAIRSR